MYKTSDPTFSLECLDEQIIEYLTCINIRKTDQS